MTIAVNKANWEVAKFIDVPAELVDYNFVIAQLLVKRGIETKSAAEQFLSPSLNQLGDSKLIAGLEVAVTRIQKAVEQQEKVVVYGDYDVDGVTSATVLVGVLKELGLEAEVYLPERLNEGYGLNTQALDKLHANGCQLVITVDNGTVAVDEIAHANRLGMEVVVIDHHEPHGEMPEAVAIVNPKIKDSKYPFKECAAVGVVYHLARVLVGEDEAQKYLELVGIGTIADVVPLVEDNRVFAVEGLRRLNSTNRPGLQALIAIAGISGKELEAYHIGFQIGPRLNAAGRIDHAKLAFDVLNASNIKEASAFAENLNNLNSSRQELSSQMLIAAQVQAEAGNKKVIVVGSERWSIGVAGIVAGRLVEQFAKPALVFEFKDGKAKGSARSVDGVHLVELIGEVEELVEQFGGHAKAAGLEVELARFDEFKTAIEQRAEKIADELLVAKVSLEMWLAADQVNLELADKLEKLAPYGFGNPTPTFGVMGATYMSCQPFGGDRFAKFLFKDDFGKYLEFVYFGEWKELQAELKAGNRYDVAFNIGVSLWRERKFLQLKLVAIRDQASN